MKKSILSIFTLIFSLTSTAQFSGGDGSINNPYKISTPSDLDNIRNYINNNFIVINDIDLKDYLSEGNPGYNEGKFWNPIKNLDYTNENFTGYFNGNNKEIKNLKINRPDEDFIGLFYKVYADSIKNLTLSNVKIIGKHYIGALAGEVYVKKLNNIFVTGEIEGRMDVGSVSSFTSGNIDNANVISKVYNGGGLFSWLGSDFQGDYSTVSNCSYTGNLDCMWQNCGGITGFGINSEINTSYTIGKINGNLFVGGIIGNAEDVLVKNSYSTSEINGISKVGGLAGSNSLRNTIENCYFAGNINSPNFGALAGENDTIKMGSRVLGYGTIINSFWDNELVGTSNTVGIESEATENQNNGLGLKTLELKIKSTYENYNWNFTDIWDIKNDAHISYPFLKTNKENPEPGKELVTFSKKITNKLINVYPNPFTNEINISSDLKILSIEIYDSYGKLIFANNVVSPKINLSELKNGIYYIKLNDEKNYNYSFKIIKQD